MKIFAQSVLLFMHAVCWRALQQQGFRNECVCGKLILHGHKEACTMCAAGTRLVLLSAASFMGEVRVTSPLISHSGSESGDVLQRPQASPCCRVTF